MNSERVPDHSRWPAILLIVGAGIVSAFQVGKAPMALTAVQADLGLSLATVSWLISAFAIVGALVGAPVGVAVDYLGARRMALAGLLLQAAGSGVGAWATGAPLLLATRVVEGVGFLAVTVAAPTLIMAVTRPRDHDRAVALWAMFMPVGMTLILLASPLLTALAWRGFWLLNAAVLIGYAGLLAWRVRPDSRSATAQRHIVDDMRQTLAARGPWLLAGLFAAFSSAFFAVFGFLPSFLTERLAITAETASTLTAVAVAASGIGNLACGLLLARGLRPTHLLSVSFAVMALCGVAIFADGVADGIAYALCILFSFISGLIPVVLIQGASRHAPRPDLVGATIGFAMQGNNIGLVVGPAVAGAVAARAGWPIVALFITVIATVAGLLILALSALPGGAGSDDESVGAAWKLED